MVVVFVAASTIANMGSTIVRTQRACSLRGVAPLPTIAPQVSLPVPFHSPM